MREYRNRVNDDESEKIMSAVHTEMTALEGRRAAKIRQKALDNESQQKMK